MGRRHCAETNVTKEISLLTLPFSRSFLIECMNFIKLCKCKYYNFSLFHRIIVCGTRRAGESRSLPLNASNTSFAGAHNSCSRFPSLSLSPFSRSPALWHKRATLLALARAARVSKGEQQRGRRHRSGPPHHHRSSDRLSLPVSHCIVPSRPSAPSLIKGEAFRYIQRPESNRLKHARMGTLSMVCDGRGRMASQFFVTLGENLSSLDGSHAVFGEVAEESRHVLEKLSRAICDDENRPYRDIRCVRQSA